MKSRPRRRRSRPAAARGPRRGSALEVVLVNRQRRRAPSRARLLRVLRGAAASLGVSGELALVFAGDGTLRRLNRSYRGKDRATDVLSFPGPGGDEGLGDVIISVPAAERNARRYGRPLGFELDLLALHGLLHLLGYDHETDGGSMDRLERRLRLRLLGRAE